MLAGAWSEFGERTHLVTVSFSCTSLSTTSKCQYPCHNSRPTPLAHDSRQAPRVWGCKRSWRQAWRGMEGTMIPSWMRSIYCSRADRRADSGVLFSSIGFRDDRARAVLSISMACSNLGAPSCRRGLVVEPRDIYRQGVGLMPPVSLRMRIGKSSRTLPTKGGLETLTMPYSPVNPIIIPFPRIPSLGSGLTSLTS